MKQSTVTICLLLVVNLTLIFFVYTLRKKEANSEYYIANYREKIFGLQNTLNALKSSSRFQFMSEYQKENVVITAPITNKTLVIRVHSNDCNDCISHSVKILEKLGLDKKLPIIVCADYPTLKAFKSDFPNLHFPVIIQPKLSTDFNQVSKPYMFIYDPQRKTASHYVYPYYQLMDVFESYASLL